MEVLVKHIEGVISGAKVSLPGMEDVRGEAEEKDVVVQARSVVGAMEVLGLDDGGGAARFSRCRGRVLPVREGGRGFREGGRGRGRGREIREGGQTVRA